MRVRNESKKDALDDAISSMKAAVAEKCVGDKMLSSAANVGFGAAREQYVDLYEAGIVDPANEKHIPHMPPESEL